MTENDIKGNAHDAADVEMNETATYSKASTVEADKRNCCKFYVPEGKSDSNLELGSDDVFYPTTSEGYTYTDFGRMQSAPPVFSRGHSYEDVFDNPVYARTVDNVENVYEEICNRSDGGTREQQVDDIELNYNSVLNNVRDAVGRMHGDDDREYGFFPVKTTEI